MAEGYDFEERPNKLSGEVRYNQQQFAGTLPDDAHEPNVGY